MALPESKKKEIREYPSYPRVTKLTEPLLVRPDRLSLLVNDTMFYAKIKLGMAAKGFLIYVSGLGIPIYDNTKSGNSKVDLYTEYGIGRGMTETAEYNAILSKAKKWLDDLEIEIADQVNDNPIKAAIDRLNWQQHYDTTGSNTDFVEEFKENDFAEVNIDWRNIDHGSGVEVDTIPVTVENAVETITGVDPDIPGPSPRGTLWTVTNQIKKLDDNMNKIGVDNTAGTLYYIGDALLNRSLSTQKSVYMGLQDVKTQTGKVATNLKADNDTYTISKALREQTDDSVSKSIDNARATISNDIQTQTSTLSGKLDENNNRLDTINGNIITASGTLTTIDGRLHESISGADWSISTIASNIRNYVERTDTLLHNTLSDNTNGILHNITGRGMCVDVYQP